MQKSIRIVLTIAFLLSPLFLSSCSGRGYRSYVSHHMGVGYNRYYGRHRRGGYNHGYVDGIDDAIDIDEPIAVPLPATGMPDMGGGDMGMGMDMGGADF